MDEVKQIQRKWVASIVGHVFELTHATICDKLIQEAKVKHCNGSTIQHPSQREQHSCVMTDNEDA